MSSHVIKWRCFLASGRLQAYATEPLCVSPTFTEWSGIFCLEIPYFSPMVVNATYKQESLQFSFPLTKAREAQVMQGGVTVLCVAGAYFTMIHSGQSQGEVFPLSVHVYLISFIHPSARPVKLQLPPFFMNKIQLANNAQSHIHNTYTFKLITQ